MHEIDAHFVAALASNRQMLRKLAHWEGTISAGPVACSGDLLDYATLVADPDANEVVVVERARLATELPGLALSPAMRWSALKRVEPHLLSSAPADADMTIDGDVVHADAWSVAAYRLLVAVHEDLRIEVWAPTGVEIAVTPLADTDTVVLSWLA